MVDIFAFYKFISIPSSKLDSLANALRDSAQLNGVRGLVILGEEGINSTVSGERAGLEQFIQAVKALLNLSEIFCKESEAPEHPFKKFVLKIKGEICTSSAPQLPVDEHRYALTPEQWQAVLESGEEFTLIDTRNHYEVEVGKFRGATDPKIENFTELAEYLKKSEIPRDRKMLMYCTGGIRCEKAIAEVLQLGFKEVYQLYGGILNYLKHFPDSHFEGECFVFDDRVAVGQHLEPSKQYVFCPLCGAPAKNEISCKRCNKQAKLCSACLSHQYLACSRDCAHHLGYRHEASITG